MPDPALVHRLLDLLQDALDLVSLSSAGRARLRYLLGEMHDAAERGNFDHVATLAAQAQLAVERARASVTLLAPELGRDSA